MSRYVPVIIPILYAFLKGGRRDYEPQSYPVPPAATGYIYICNFFFASTSEFLNNNASSFLFS